MGRAREIVKEQPVVILPIGSTEDHGLHLPLDVDNFLSWEACEEAARRAPDEMLLLPQIPYGFEDHHMDYPGTITVTSRHLMDFVIDITKSVAHHGFRKVLIVDGHGSNMPVLDLAARQTVVETDAHCGVVAWWNSSGSSGPSPSSRGWTGIGGLWNRVNQVNGESFEWED